MNERVEAAKDSLWKDLDSGSPEWTLGVAERALAAADAVMFSDEAVRSAVKALYKEQETGSPYGGLDLQVKAVIAALKGGRG